jgi:DNA-binding response OmpR family regulator
MSPESILIVEDEPALLRGLKDNLTAKGFGVLTAADGEAGLQLALDRKPDLILLDIMLPKINGYEVCRLIRKEGLDTPVIMLTAKGEESDVVLGLEIGADDYITKPFSVRELLARVNALLRRRREGETRVHEFGGFRLEADSRKLLRDGKEVPLTPKEFEVLELLARNGGRALSRDDILRKVWGYNVFVTTRSVDRCINTLRAKIEKDPRDPVFIKTVREVGYRFEG